jgi:hypothetical protein
MMALNSSPFAVAGDIVKNHIADARLRFQVSRVARKAAIRAAFIVCQTDFPGGQSARYAVEPDILTNANVESAIAETMSARESSSWPSSNNNVVELNLGKHDG